MLWSGWVNLPGKKVRCSDQVSQWMFCTPELRAKTNDEHVFYYSARRVSCQQNLQSCCLKFQLTIQVEAFVGMLITVFIFILLVLPVIVMYNLSKAGESTTTFKAVGVLVVFTLLFSAAMSMLTKARRHELFAASAAYCAILVVFISNFNQ